MAQLMKGETFKDACKLVRGKPRFSYPVYVEEKADEIRCRVWYSVGHDALYWDSYAEKALHNMEFLNARILAFMRQTAHFELDIGIEVNGNFNDSYRWTRSSSGYPKEKLDKKTGKVAPALDESMVQIILFDLPRSTLPFVSRLEIIDWVAETMKAHGIPTRRPVRKMAGDEAQVFKIYRQFREQGLEGAMAKTQWHLYDRRRTFDWMKVKPSDEADGIIEEFNEAISLEGEPLGRVGSLVLVMEDGSRASPHGIPHELGRLMWENRGKYRYTWATFNYMERDRSGGYRHPTFDRLREDKA